MIDIFDNIREDICEEIIYLVNEYGGININYLRNLVESMDKDNIKVLDHYKLGENHIIIRCTSDIFKNQLYTDYYRVARYKNRIFDTKIKELPKATENQIKKVFYDNDICNNMFRSMLMTYFGCDMEKVLLNKSLTNEDVKYLKSINPYFEDEYKRYNKNIDLDFIKNEIYNLKDSRYPNMEYEMVAALIFNLYKVDKENTERLFGELLDRHAIIYSTKEEKENIKIGKYIITKDRLALNLKNFYEFEEKKLKYKKDDSSENK